MAASTAARRGASGAAARSKLTKMKPCQTSTLNSGSRTLRLSKSQVFSMAGAFTSSPSRE